jgi:hypothetical protein
VISERTRAAYELWSFAQSLVVRAARTLAQDFNSVSARMELGGALRAEQKTRAAFERAMKAESGS